MSAPIEPRPRYTWDLWTLSMIEFKIWDVTGQAVIQSNAVYIDDLMIPHRRNIGAALLDWNLQVEQPLPRIVYDLGKEIQLSWRELSSPKE